MEGFTIIDGVVAAVIVLSALLAYSRGFVREALAIAGWIVAAMLAFMFARPAGDFVGTLPVIGDMIADQCELLVIAGFAAVLAVALAVFGLFTPLFSGMIRRSALDAFDQGLGFFFGVIRGIILVAVAFFVYNTILSSSPVEIVDSSRSAKIFNKLTGQIEEQDPEAAMGWMTARYSALLGHCSIE